MNEFSIAHVLSSFGIGGQERVALDLARAQRAQGHRVLAVSLASSPPGSLADNFRDADVVIETVAKRGPSVDPSLPLRLAKVLRRHGVDVVHTHNPHALIYGAPAAALARAASVHTKHGLNSDLERRRWLRRTASRFVDAYVAVTQKLAAVAVEKQECDPSRLHVIPNGIDVRHFAPDTEARQRIRAELAIPADAWVVGTVGRLAPEKNQALLIRAAAPLLDPRRHLLLVGDGPEHAALSQQIADSCGAGLVHLTGARSDVAALLAAFDVFALTSDSEGLPLVVLEAMAAKLPVVSTAVGGVPDVIEDSVTGYLVPAGDATALTRRLAYLSSRPPEALEVVRSAYDNVLARHSLEHMAGAYETLYRGVRARSPRQTEVRVGVAG